MSAFTSENFHSEPHLCQSLLRISVKGDTLHLKNPFFKHCTAQENLSKEECQVKL